MNMNLIVKLNRVYEKNFTIGPLFGGVEFISYQLALGISFRWWASGGPAFRIYFGPFKIWGNILMDKISELTDVEEIEKLQKEGHTHHCACRIIWGDGECECEKRNKIPGLISREMNEIFFW